MFNTSQFATISQDNLDESNDSDLNQRIFNLINQLRLDNSGITQPFRCFFLGESNINHDELKSLLCEDQYKGEQYYVDFLADVHGQIQSKMN